MLYGGLVLLVVGTDAGGVKSGENIDFAVIFPSDYWAVSNVTADYCA